MEYVIGSASVAAIAPQNFAKARRERPPGRACRVAKGSRSTFGRIKVTVLKGWEREMGGAKDLLHRTTRFVKVW